MSGVSQSRGSGGSGLPYLGPFVWANRPSAAANSGKTFFCSDIDSGVLLVSNGSQWRGLSSNTTCLLTDRLSVFTPSSGSIGDNGALSGIAALPTTYGEGVYLYFPENAIAAGVAAGLYYCVMSSATAGTIYNNVYTGGPHVIPASPAAFSTTGPGAYTQTTSAVTLTSVTIPGLALKNWNKLQFLLTRLNANSGNNKNIAIAIGSTSFYAKNETTTTSNRIDLFTEYLAANTLMRFATNVNGWNTGVVNTIVSENVTSDATITITGTLSNAADYVGINGVSIVLGGS